MLFFASNSAAKSTGFEEEDFEGPVGATFGGGGGGGGGGGIPFPLFEVTFIGVEACWTFDELAACFGWESTLTKSSPPDGEVSWLSIYSWIEVNSASLILFK